MTRFLADKRFTVGLILLVLVGIGSVFARGASSGPAPPSFDRVGAAGLVTRLLATDHLLMRARKNGEATGETRLLGTRQGQAFYRIPTASGRDCYGVGPMSSSEVRLDVLQCSRVFPSQDYPVLPFLTVVGGGESGEAKVIHADGIAADGVSAVAFTTPDGRYLARTEVGSNVYRITNIPTEALTAFVAFSGSGDVVFSQPLP